MANTGPGTRRSSQRPGRTCRRASPATRRRRGGPPRYVPPVGRPPLLTARQGVAGCHPRPAAAPDATTPSVLQVERQLDLGLGRRRDVARDHLSPCALIPTCATGDRQREVQRPVDDRALGGDLPSLGGLRSWGHWASTRAALAVDTKVQTTPTRPTCSPCCRRLPENTTSSPRLKPGAPRSIFGSDSVNMAVTRMVWGLSACPDAAAATVTR